MCRKYLAGHGESNSLEKLQPSFYSFMLPGVRPECSCVSKLGLSYRLNNWTAKNTPHITTPISSGVLRSPVNTLYRVSNWIQTCEQSHSECKQQTATNYVPKRLLEIFQLGLKLSVRLVSLDRAVPYTALSYCWGTKQRTTCTRFTESSWKDSGIPWDEIPETILDAILVTSQLDMKYLWVDAFCIVQDDELDMETQIAQMPHIYNNAVITVSAHNAESVNEGFLNRELLPIVYFGELYAIRARGFILAQDKVILTNHREITPLKGTFCPEPLDRRGWVLQESLLSRRWLKFTSGAIEWQCQRKLPIDFEEAKASYAFQNLPLHPTISQMRHRANFNYIMHTGKLYFENGLGHYEEIPSLDFDQPNEYPWQSLVKEYTSRSLSLVKDRSLAISGIAEQIGTRTGDKYCAGLWKSCLVDQLAWFAIACHEMYPEDRSLLGTDPDKILAPSWSWFSISAPVEFRVDNVLFTLEIIDVTMKLAHKEAPFGNVESGRLTVQGLVRNMNDTDRQHCADLGFSLNKPITKRSGRIIHLKLGQYRKSSEKSDPSAICLNLQNKYEHTWTRVGLSMQPDRGWSEPHILTII